MIALGWLYAGVSRGLTLGLADASTRAAEAPAWMTQVLIYAPLVGIAAWVVLSRIGSASTLRPRLMVAATITGGAAVVWVVTFAESGTYA